jgi:ABC-type nitrate/sulfonate/bicarbonate transport system substrate-binding protein
VRRIILSKTWLMMPAFACHGAWAVTPIKFKMAYTNAGGFTGLFSASDQGMFAERGLDMHPLLPNIRPRPDAARLVIN